jgi:hypothetical protein
MESDTLKRSLYSVGAVAILAIFGVASIDSNTNTSQPVRPSPTATKEIVHTGEIGVLRAGDSTSGVVLGSDRQANDELTKMAANHDQEGFAAMMLSGRAFAVPAGTKVRVLDTFFSLGFLPTSVQVRVLEGKQYGRAGVVPFEWVVPPSSIESATPEVRKAKPVLSPPRKRN